MLEVMLDTRKTRQKTQRASCSFGLVAGPEECMSTLIVYAGCYEGKRAGCDGSTQCRRGGGVQEGPSQKGRSKRRLKPE